ncbi:MAG: hypothetical protein PVJ02_11565 [Gemmatimonadota bacterium]|jgi:hypothetical protein
MKHLDGETLARLVDETPQPGEAEHLAACASCSSELGAMRAQTRSLAGLPEIRPPLGDWEVLEARLRSEGLVETPSLFDRLTLAKTPAWMRAAAGAALFIGGSLVGGGFASRGALDGDVGMANASATARGSRDVDQAASAVLTAQQRYVDALSNYRQLLEEDGGPQEALGDPRSRYAALQYLVAASQAAVRQAPADPFLNGLLASTLAEREATLRKISSGGDNWF